MASVEYRDVNSGPLRIGVLEDGEDRVLRLAGELELATVPLAEEELERALAETGSRVLVDLSELEFLDSTGIALLVRALEGDGAEGRLRFVPSRSTGVNRVLEVTGVGVRLPLADGLDG